MSQVPGLPQAALKYEAEVQEHGKLELTVPFSSGDGVAVFVLLAGWDHENSGYNELLHPERQA